MTAYADLRFRGAGLAFMNSRARSTVIVLTPFPLRNLCMKRRLLQAYWPKVDSFQPVRSQ